MRYRTLAVFCLCVLLAPPFAFAQGPENSATLEIEIGLQLKATIDKFAYGPGEFITAVLKLINETPAPITIESSRTCAGIGQMERWCDRDYDVCVGYYSPIEGHCTQQVQFPHGETILQTKVFRAFDSPSVMIPDSGQILFLDPWGEPVAYKIILTYDNSASLAVEGATWGFVKQLYKR